MADTPERLTSPPHPPPPPVGKQEQGEEPKWSEGGAHGATVEWKEIAK